MSLSIGLSQPLSPHFLAMGKDPYGKKNKLQIFNTLKK